MKAPAPLLEDASFETAMAHWTDCGLSVSYSANAYRTHGQVKLNQHFRVEDYRGLYFGSPKTTVFNENTLCDSDRSFQELLRASIRSWNEHVERINSPRQPEVLILQPT